MLLAHLSDPHVVDWSGLAPARFLNKRLTGWVNFRFVRRRVHRREVVEALLDDIVAQGPDHVAVTGDLSSLAFAQEMRRFVGLLRERGLDGERVSVVPGNHDAYTRGAWLRGVFSREVGEHCTSDLDVGARGGFPFVRLRGQTAIVGLSSAVPRPPFFANGMVGPTQRRRLESLLRRPEVAARLPIVLVHHPLLPHRAARKEVQAGLLDRDRVVAALGRGLAGRPALVLAGHWHSRAVRRLELPGPVWHVQAPSASHFGGGPDRLGGYNLIELGADGAGRPRLERIVARSYDPRSGEVRSGEPWTPE